MAYVVWAVVFFVNRIRFLIIFKILLEFSRGQTMYYSFIMKISVLPFQGDYSESPPPDLSTYERTVLGEIELEWTLGTIHSAKGRPCQGGSGATIEKVL